MKKQKWWMMGMAAVVCSALFVPGAFAKEKDDAYVAPAAVLVTADTAAAVYPAQDHVYQVPTYGPASFFAAPESEDSKN